MSKRHAIISLLGTFNATDVGVPRDGNSASSGRSLSVSRQNPSVGLQKDGPELSIVVGLGDKNFAPLRIMLSDDGTPQVIEIPNQIRSGFTSLNPAAVLGSIQQAFRSSRDYKGGALAGLSKALSLPFLHNHSNAAFDTATTQGANAAAIGVLTKMHQMSNAAAAPA